MFWNKTFKIKKEMIPIIRPTSKAALKIQCLTSCQGDVEKASKLYDFLIKDMEDLPTLDVPQPTTMQQVKESVGQGFNWLKENQNDIIQGVQWIRSMFGKGDGMMPPPPPPSAPPQAIPPIQ